MLAVVAAPFSYANNAFVDCSGATPGAFTSIAAALSTFPQQGQNFLSITGTCVESPVISGFDLLSFQGQGAVIKPNVANGVVNILHSRVFVSGSLVFDGGGIIVQEHSEVQLRGVTIENCSQSEGILAIDSTVSLFNSTVKNGGFSGIFVNQSSFTMNGDTITGNASGVSALRGHLSLTGGNVISNNTFDGMNIAETSTAEMGGGNDIDSNGNNGLLVSETSVFRMDGGEIVNNKVVGIRMIDARGFIRNVNITGSPSAAVDAIDVEGISHLFLGGGVDISASKGNGILLQDGAVLTSDGGNNISNNGRDGVLLKGMALAHFLHPDTITGNGEFSLHCDHTSLIEADVSGLPHSQLRCSRIVAP